LLASGKQQVAQGRTPEPAKPCLGLSRALSRRALRACALFCAARKTGKFGNTNFFYLILKGNS
jgi:hypothetical protein